QTMGRAARGAATVRPLVQVENGRKVLRVGGVIQSVGVDEAHVPDIWDAMLPLVQPRSALILGLGGGTMATLMTLRWGPVPILRVEHDAVVAWLARHEFGLAALPNVVVQVEDAFAYARRSNRCFDAICVDLYIAGRMSHGVLAGGFLRD